MKLSPLVLFILVGFYFVISKPDIVVQNYTPLAPLGFDNFGAALVLVFWAYVGFEMGTLPASEVKDPKKTIPRAITIGILIVLAFYLLTNFVLFGVANWTDLAKTKVPLVHTSTLMMGAAGAFIIGVGALISVSGSNESGTLGISRLSYAMAIHGLLPKIFSKTHHKFKTPYVALITQGTVAFVLSNLAGITNLISFSVFNLAFSFFLVCLSLVVLKKKNEHSLHGQKILPLVGMAICAYLLYSTSTWDKIIGTAIILIGIPIYAFFSPKADIHHLKDLFLAEEEIFARTLERKERFLAHFVVLCHRLYSRLSRR
jgi:amino acid transporter